MSGRSIVFQNTKSDVFIVDDTVELCDGNVEIPGEDVLTLVDADRDHCVPNEFLLEASNLRIVLTSSPRTRQDRKWIQQYGPYTIMVLVMEPWTNEEILLSACVRPN